ncbi:DUF3015 domain-containing protein [Zoogloea sp.]|uniref:DUF3015 domain-containing protein n=1 Tax=Zoogloea sp. TaxID=49181 RepID=UPI002633B541|nr:DUF3015 domain-containing protein [Zoogloea sp.]MDD3352227.1 DUF3015 domain-containing protein [Zoogloea sp.]
MKKIILAALVSVPFTAFAAANNVGSCGLGSKVFEGQRGVAPQVLAATTNGTFGNQTFGITSGTLGCTQDGVVSSSWKTAMFIDGNKSQLARDAASGQGETLDALAALLKVDAADKAAFVSLTKARHSEIFASVESAESIATRLKAALQSDARLAKYAEAV